MSALPVLINAPLWARDSEDDGQGPDAKACDQTSAPTRADRGQIAWAAFVSECSTRYGPGGERTTPIAAVEVWNEPNLGVFWGGVVQQNVDVEPGRFAELVTVAADNTSLPVLPAGIAQNKSVYKEAADQFPVCDEPVQFLRDATDPSTISSIDPTDIAGTAVHLYANRKESNRRAVGQVLERYTQYREGLRPGFDGKPRWLTEVGFPSAGTGELSYATKAIQRQRLREAYFHLKRKDQLQAFIIHRLVDDDDPDADDPDLEPENGNFGTINRNGDGSIGQPKWIFCRLARMATGIGLDASTCEARNA